MTTQVRPDPQQDPEAWRAYWISQIAEAQDTPEYKIEGKRYARIPYGQESSDARFGPCHDCDVIVGQLHVPGCDSEMCPKCEGQAITCYCNYFPGDSEPAKRATWELMKNPTVENARRLGFRV